MTLAEVSTVSTSELLWKIYNDPTAPMAVDTEDTGLSVYSDRPIGISLAGVFNGEPISLYIPVGHFVGENADEKTQAMLAWVLEQPDRLLIFANAQFDLAMLLNWGIDLIDHEFIDILTMANLIDENNPREKSLESLSQFYLGDEGKVKDPLVEKEKKTGNRNITPEQIYEYAVVDAELTYRDWAVLVEHPEWVRLMRDTDVWPEKLKLIRVLLRMRLEGVKVNIPFVREAEAEGTAIINELKAEMGFNPASPKDKKRIFLDELKLPVIKRSKKTGDPGFDKDVMAAYDILLSKMDNPLAKNMVKFSGWQKAVTASYRPYLKFVDPDGRIRASFHTHRTTTGRLSCSEPNLQQIPKETDKPWNGRVKESFIAKEGYVLLSADYSQLELRLACAYTGEPAIKQIFAEGRDIFSEMAEELGMTRQDTKTFVYTIQYGGGVKRIMEVFGVDMKTARKMRNNFYTTYPGFRAFNDFCADRVEKSLQIMLWTGRLRKFQYRSDKYKAMNSVFQGGGADIVERIMVRAYDELQSEDCRMLMQVHDALVFEVRKDRADEYAVRIKELMEDVNAIVPDHLPKFDVRFNVEVTQWGK